jgi:hypothetical protein
VKECGAELIKQGLLQHVGDIWPFVSSMQPEQSRRLARPMAAATVKKKNPFVVYNILD